MMSVRRAKPSMIGDKRRAGRKNALRVRKDIMAVREEEHDGSVDFAKLAEGFRRNPRSLL